MTGDQPVLVGGCSLLALPVFVDERGSLAVGQLGGALPFEVRRFFVVHDVPDGSRRGGHGHRHTQSMLVALSGTVEVELRHRGTSSTVVLDDPVTALYIAPRVWAAQRFLHRGQLLVLASGVYDPSDYYQDPDEF